MGRTSTPFVVSTMLRKTFINIVLLLALVPLFSVAQGPVIEGMKEYSLRESLKQPRERLYMHLDRGIFMAGETVWFKVYSFCPSRVESCIFSDRVIVDLVGPKMSRLYTTNICLIDGLGTGFLKLPDTLTTNYYGVLAYTNYMIQCDSSYYLDKIAVFNVNDSTQESSADSSESAIPGILTFYPEGGNLVEGLESVVYFSSRRGDHPWTNISGRIVSSDGRTLSHFRSSNSGLGSFTLLPRHGEMYTAVIDGLDRSFPLPRQLEKGYTLHVTNIEKAKNLLLSVKTNHLQANNKVLVMVHSGGLILYNFLADLAPGQLNGAIPKKVLKEGLNTISVFDSLGNLLAERSTFIAAANSPRVSIVLDKESFEKRSKVKATIKVTDEDGRPIRAFMSLSATDESQAPFDNGKKTIESYYSLFSAFDFQASSPGLILSNDDSSKDIEDYVLTHQRKKYRWESLKAPLPIEPQFGFTLRGRLMDEFREKPVPQGRVSYMSNDSVPFYGNIDTDLEGRFTIDSIYAFGNSTIFLQGEYKKKKSFGKIRLDTVQLGIVPKEIFIGSLTSLGSLQKQIIQMGANRRYADLSYDARNDNIQLEEVVVQAKKDVELIRKDAPRVTGNTLVIEPKDVNGANHPAELLRSVPGVKVSITATGGYRIIRRGKELKVFWDGFWFPDPSILGAYSASQVGRIEVHGSAVYMWSKALGAGTVDKKQSLKYILKGYQNSRKFIAPSYEVQHPSHVKPDYRATLLWEPNLATDSLGHAYVEFYTSDLEGEIHIQVEGITVDGKPIIGKKTFVVQTVK